MTAHDVINDVILCQILGKSLKLSILPPEASQYIDCVGLPPIIIIDFLGYLSDLMSFYYIMTTYDVTNDVIWCRILRKSLKSSICSPEPPQYIDFVGFPPQIIDFLGCLRD